MILVSGYAGGAGSLPAAELAYCLHPLDLAGCLAEAVEALGVEEQRIDIGWDRPVSNDAHFHSGLVRRGVRRRTAANAPVRRRPGFPQIGGRKLRPELRLAASVLMRRCTEPI